MSDKKVLLIQSSARSDASLTRRLARDLADSLGNEIVERDVASDSESIDGAWVAANFTAVGDRSVDQADRLSGSDALVRELMDADAVVIGMPIYNFGMPASLKAWIDQIARARVTFEYTDKGPRGLLAGKRAYIVVASGGTEVMGDIDFATPHLKHVLGFVGIHDVTIIDAGQQMARGEDAIHQAEARIAEIADAA